MCVCVCVCVCVCTVGACACMCACCEYAWDTKSYRRAICGRVEPVALLR